MKKLIHPLANIITELLHIPGEISAGFSMVFLVVATEVVAEGELQVTLGERTVMLCRMIHILRKLRRRR